MAIELVDKKMKCNDCQRDFVFAKGEQQFYLEKAYAEPRRCPDCRKLRKKDRRKKRKTLIRALRAAEDVKVQVEVITTEQTVMMATTNQGAIGVSVKQETVSVGMVPAAPAPVPANPDQPAKKKAKKR